jgi:cyclophilin family peptidyl-prolyl cis-trans isomerase
VSAILLGWATTGYSITNPQVTLRIAGAVNGDIVIELDPNKAPITVANFLSYVRTGFYNGLIFHRVVKDFCIQAGAYDKDVYDANITGASGFFNQQNWDIDPRFYHTPNAPIKNESYNWLRNTRGTIAMAMTNAPNSGTSQFFINQVDNNFLDYGMYYYYYNYIANPPQPVPPSSGYCVFGTVVSGLNYVDSIANQEVKIIGPEGVTPFETIPKSAVLIQSAFVSRAGCSSDLVGDMDGNCVVNLKDFVKMAGSWLVSKPTF